MYISIHTYNEKVSNPYYSTSNSRIEPEFIEETKHSIREFQNIEAFKLHIKDTFSRIDTASKWSYFKAEEINPRVTVEVNIDI